MTSGGEIVLTARRFRTQDANRADARVRLTELIEAAHDLPAKRAKSRVNRLNKAERLAGKKRRGAVKAGRGKVALD
jgi:ribosome-associated protein